MWFLPPPSHSTSHPLPDASLPPILIGLRLQCACPSHRPAYRSHFKKIAFTPFLGSPTIHRRGDPLCSVELITYDVVSAGDTTISKASRLAPCFPSPDWLAGHSQMLWIMKPSEWLALCAEWRFLTNLTRRRNRPVRGAKATLAILYKIWHFITYFDSPRFLSVIPNRERL